MECVKNENLIIIFNYIELNYQKILLNTYANIIIKNVINAKHFKQLSTFVNIDTCNKSKNHQTK